MSKLDLTSLEWRDIVFQGKNKEYGAYVLRKESAKRHNLAMLIIFVAIVVGFTIPRLMTLLKSDKEVKVEYGPTIMTKLPPAKVEDKHIKKVESVEPPPALKTSVKFTAPVIKKDEEVSEEDELKSQEEISNTKGIISIADVKGNDEINGKDIGDLKENVIQVEKEEILESVEQMPSFPGGDNVLMSYLRKNLRYPQISIENNIQGTVTVRFAVSKTGAIEKAEIVRSTVDAACDKEALRVVRAMPAWIPGKQNGANVAVWYTLPVKFRLNGE